MSIAPQRRAWLVVFLAFVLVIGLVLAVRSGRLPRGVRGEWEWPFLPANVSTLPADPVPAVIGVLAYVILVPIGAARLVKRSRLRDEVLWLIVLTVGSIIAQLSLLAAAPPGYGLAKWVTIDLQGSSGYFTIARTDMGEVGPFLADYPEWVANQDALHVGTHPPGLFLLAKGSLLLMGRDQQAAARFLDAFPVTVTEGMRAVFGPKPNTEKAAIALIGLLTLLACAGTVVPLYILARSALDPHRAFAAAALWPLLPSAVMFQPASDTAFPFLAASAMALTVWSRSGKMGLLSAFAAGLTLAIGMQFSLVFLGVGLVVGLLVGLLPGASWKRRLAAFLVVGAGFLVFTLAWWALTRCNPFLVWWTNQRNHQRFYVEYPRTYTAWLPANSVELAVGLGLPVALWMVIGLRRVNMSIISWAALGVLALLTLSGKSLSEVGRLWLPFMPALAVGAGAGMDRLKAGPLALAATILLVALETAVLQVTIQVVYPF